MKRREALKILGTGAVAAAGTVAAGTASAQTPDQEACKDVTNPYGGGPGTGVSLPEYFKPTCCVVAGS